MDAPIRILAPFSVGAHRCSQGVSAALARRARRIVLLFGLALALAAPPAQTFEGEGQAPAGPGDHVLDSSAPSAANWVVLEAIGQAVWRAQGEPEWREFEPGEVLPPGCEIETGLDGEVMLVAGGDQLTIAPLGRLIVPEAAPGQDRRLRHERGRILVHIESRTKRDVQVKTPLLSLGIKGTTFEIEVDSEQNSVVVHDGEVEVTPPDGQDPVALGAGEGLRQPADPGSTATRFAAPPHEMSAPASSVRAEQPPSIPGRTGGEAMAEERRDSTRDFRASADRSSGQSGKRSSTPTKGPWSWVDDWASSWAWVAVAGVAVLILGIPLLALVHNLRERLRSRPGDKGRRRRELVRG
jgi:FecR protein